jgi:hypothetical protein
LFAARIAVPHRHPVAPPQLARDVPVTDVLEPVDVDRLPALGEDANGTVAHALERGPGQRLHANEPLIGKPRLDDGVAAVTMPHCMRVRLDPDELT